MKVIKGIKRDVEIADRIRLVPADGRSSRELISDLIVALDNDAALDGRRVRIIAETPRGFQFEFVDDETPIPQFIAKKTQRLFEAKRNRIAVAGLSYFYIIICKVPLLFRLK